MDFYDDTELHSKFRFHGAEILAIVDEVRDAVEHPATRHGSLPALLQVLVALRFYATGRFQNMVAEMVGIDQSTASRTIHRVTIAMLTHIGQWVRLPTQQVYVYDGRGECSSRDASVFMLMQSLLIN